MIGRRCVRVLAVAASLAVLSGCLTLVHTVGKGPRARPERVEASQWYALGGLIPMDVVDSKRLAGGATDYRVTTTFTFLDVVIDFFTSFVGFLRQTIIVEK
jgi:hypothetical protein